MRYELPEGAKVFITHFRKWEEPYTGFTYLSDMPDEDWHILHPNEGGTLAEIHVGEKIVEGWAQCGKNDNFCKRIGRDIAVGRALKQFKTAQEPEVRSLSSS